MIMDWNYNPPTWSIVGDAIHVTSAPKTDFWRKTHYGFVRDNGHFYHREVKGDFIAEVRVSGRYHALYDQAGLMVRADKSNWIKCGVELVDGIEHLSAVVTRGHSDWSLLPLAPRPHAIFLRITRKGDVLEMHYSFDQQNYSLLRIAYLEMDEKVQVGVMCASPDGLGFAATFEGLSIVNLE